MFDSERVMRLVKARCGDALSDAELSFIKTEAETVEAIIAKLEALENRFDELIEHNRAAHEVAEAARVFIDEAADPRTTWQ